MIRPEIFILLGIGMLLLMACSKKDSQDITVPEPGNKPPSSILRAQINAINVWFEYGPILKDKRSKKV